MSSQLLCQWILVISLLCGRLSLIAGECEKSQDGSDRVANVLTHLAMLAFYLLLYYGAGVLTGLFG